MRCRGLTAITREKYYPEYRFVPGGTWSGSAVGGGGEGGVLVKKKKRDGGMSRGRRVDVEVERWIKGRVRASAPSTTNTKKKFSTRAFVVTASAAAEAASATSKKRKKKDPEEPSHPLARAFVALTTRLRLVPVGAQVVVRDEQCDLATLVDGVFVDERGRVVLVELKCGFEGYNDTSNGYMRSPFQKFTNAPKHQHQLQLAFTRCMFERTFPEFGRVDARIVRMTDRGAHVTKIDDDLDATARRVFAAGRRV